MHDMDIHIGDLYSTIVDREIEIIQGLSDEVLVHDAAISQACHIFAELDCLLSFADASQAYNYRRPVMVEDNVIDIWQGRHPLQEQVIDTFVPNNARLVGGAGRDPADQDYTSDSEIDLSEWNSVLLCTGANACGKLLNCTDGAGLFCGTLQHLLARGKACPKVLAATHFHDVFRVDLLDPQLSRISFRHMEVMFTASDGSLLPIGADTDTDTDAATDGAGVRCVGVGEKITYLYRVAEGLSLDSHAAKCAEMFGVPSRLVQRAQYVSHLLSTHELGRLLDEGMTEEERLDLQDAEAVCRRFLAWDLDAPDQDADAKTMLARCLGRKQDDDMDTDER
ncbi:hypothetical protein DXG01_007047 [Tephrocybe rancida]|nr:hypothetical protein DXG01_007047 [Tephrocybe rancida]